MDFSTGNAVITGGASGIGLGLAHKVAEEGMTIINKELFKVPLMNSLKRATRPMGVSAMYLTETKLKNLPRGSLTSSGLCISWLTMPAL